MGLPTYDEFVSHLTATRALSEETVSRRSQFLHEDIARMEMDSFSLIPLHSHPSPFPGCAMTVVEYQFGEVPFDAENAGDPFCVQRTVKEMSGSGVDRGELLHLSKVCEIGRTLAPKLWFNDAALKADFRDPGKHLSTLNEVWWLSLWEGLSEEGLGRESRLCSGSSKTIDWRFPLVQDGEEWFINLEVKQPVHSFANRAYGKPHYFYSSLNPDGTVREDDPSLKFRESGPNEINVLAMTWFDDISEQLESCIQDFLNNTTKIDAVLIWAPGDRRRGSWYRMFPRFRELSKKRAALHSVLKSPDEEDHSRIIWTIFPRTIDSILEESRNV